MLHATAMHQDNSPSLRFDRRREERREAKGKVTALRQDQGLTIHCQPTCSLTLRDISLGGLGATSDVPLEPHESLAICFPPHGPERGLDLYGYVVRCEPIGKGYKVAIRFERKLAA